MRFFATPVAMLFCSESVATAAAAAAAMVAAVAAAGEERTVSKSR
jgi:hypothetical protein